MKNMSPTISTNPRSNNIQNSKTKKRPLNPQVSNILNIVVNRLVFKLDFSLPKTT